MLFLLLKLKKKLRGWAHQPNAHMCAHNTRTRNRMLGRVTGIVFVPPGQYRFNGSVVVPPAVTLQGSYDTVPSHDCRQGEHKKTVKEGRTEVVLGWHGATAFSRSGSHEATRAVVPCWCSRRLSNRWVCAHAHGQQGKRLCIPLHHHQRGRCHARVCRLPRGAAARRHARPVSVCHCPCGEPAHIRQRERGEGERGEGGRERGQKRGRERGREREREGTTQNSLTRMRVFRETTLRSQMLRS